MPLREWAKKHIHKKDSKVHNEPTVSDKNDPPEFKVFRSDTLGITPLQIPDAGYTVEKGGLTSSSPGGITPKSPKGNRLSLLGARHRSSSQVSLPDWDPPDDSDPNAERDWEVRATKLAKLRPNSMNASREDLADLAKLSVKDDLPKTSSDGRLLPKEGETGWAPLNIIDGMPSDEALQEAIRLHEAGGKINYFTNEVNDRIGESYSAVQENCRTACWR
jgi:hypothetical protein